MKIALIDDEKIYREKITKELLKEYQKEDIDDFSSVSCFLKAKTYYDLVLLDIEMPDMNGIQFAQENQVHIPNLIYVTSHTNFMADAFGKNVLGFIAKDQIETVLLSKVKKAEDIISCIENFTFHISNQDMMIPRKDILYFQLKRGFIYLKTRTHTYILNCTSLSQLKHKLNDYFFPVNRNYIINIENIEKVDKSTRTIIFQDQVPIIVSERNWVSFKRLYSRMVKIL